MVKMWNWIGILAFAMVVQARAEVTNFSIDPDRSVVELRGTVLAFGLNLALNSQATGSMQTRWTGTLQIEETTNTIQFVGGNWISVMDSGIWEPDTNGVVGSAPANYGARAANYVAIIVSGFAAFRQMGFDTISPPLALQNGQFPVRQIQMRFVEAARSAVDYWFSVSNNIGDPDFTESVLANAPVFGRAYLQGGITNRATNAARLSVEAGVQTLRIPIDARCAFVARAATGPEFRFSLVLVGQLVATPSAIVTCEPLWIDGPAVRLFWPPGYRLQGASRLSPADWSDLASEGPLELPANEPAQFFRAIGPSPVLDSKAQ